MELTAAHVAAPRSTKKLDAMNGVYALLKSKLDVLHAAGERREGVLRNFVERV